MPSPLHRKLEHLYPLTADEEAVLQRACSRTVEFAAGEDIVSHGDQPKNCTLLLKGMVCRYKLLEDGKRQIFSFHVPGDIFDAQSFLLDTMDHSAGTITASTVALISHATMAEITEAYPRIARAIWKETLVDAAIFREWMASIGRRSSYQRIAHLMCELFVKCEVVGLAHDGQISWPITQAELGDALGLSNVHVNRTLKELRGEGLITLQNHILVVHDWNRLKAAGRFDPEYLHLKRVAHGDGSGRPAEPLVGVHHRLGR